MEHNYGQSFPYVMRIAHMILEQLIKFVLIVLSFFFFSFFYNLIVRGEGF